MLTKASAFNIFKFEVGPTVKARPKIVLLREVQMNASRLAPVNKKSNNS